MSAAIFVLAIGTGTLVGWVLTMTGASAAISRSQARMERKVRYWQDRASHAAEQARQLAELAGQSRG